ncbi:signal recognition particle-docking protein FtsY [bacterium]|nr:signal recognition particle-docking protein FtsY [bacterium]
MRRSLTRLLSGLGKTRAALLEGLRSALGNSGALDENALESIEETLIAADVGVGTALRLVDILKNNTTQISSGGVEAAVDLIACEMEEILKHAGSTRDELKRTRPHVIMVIGVNGTGKTTTAGKLAALERRAGRSVLMAAADTFRAAACEQLTIWAERSGSDLIAGEEGGDSASVAYDALSAAIARDTDVLIVDTAGRLHTQKNLLEELIKIRRVLGKRMPGAPHEVLLVIDANTGQNALSQAKLFHDAVEVSGIALTKLDGTARGGIAVAIARELRIPVHLIGLGEGVDDIEVFDPQVFASALIRAN